MTTPLFAEAAARVAAGADPHHEAAQLVAQMTPAERLGCLDGDLPFWPGLFDMMGGGYYSHPWPAAVVERLGVPGIQFADGPRGCVIGDATAFPVSMARGATFDPDLERRVGEAIGAELRASGATFTGAVCMNLLRHPAWGRAQETYGEDPLHVGVMAAALTSGLQEHVMACMKHFALNSMENARFTVDVTVDERALHEVYLPHFKRVAGEGVASVMSAYNSVNGSFCGENEMLLTAVLRDEWQWDGFVISDFIFGLRDAQRSVAAGLDIEMPFRQQRAVKLAAALDDGTLDAAAVERSAQRTVATLLRFHRVFGAQPPEHVVGCDQHRILAREVAVASAVLLRNEAALLPIDPATTGLIAVVGRLAAARNLGDGGSSDVKSSAVVTVVDGLRGALGDARVAHADDDVTIVDGADVAVVVVGYTKDDEGEYIDQQGTAALIETVFPPTDHAELGIGAVLGHQWPQPAGGPPFTVEGEPSMAPGGDRSSLRLRPADEELIAAVAARHQRVVVVVVSGSAVIMPWADSVSAVLMTWYPGVEGGAALADMLTGIAAPKGRLPFAVPFDEAHLPFFDKSATSITYDSWHGQWKLDRDGVAAHFPFGWGLGYGAIDIERAEPATGGTVRVVVRNPGGRDASSVVFVHGGLPDSSYERPARRLVGFCAVDVRAGAERELDIAVDWSMLDVRANGAWLTEPGDYQLTVGQYAGDPNSVTFVVARS
jgi:beta-glucosidase